MNGYKIAVTSAFGVESATKKELKSLGVADPKAVDGSFIFDGDALDVARLNVFLRTGDRVLIRLGEFPAETFDDLFDGVRALPLEDCLAPDSAVTVNGKSVKSKLFSLSDCQKIIKKAVVDRLCSKFKLRVFPENGAKTEILFSIRNDVASIFLNTSGKGLHKRGYRDLVGDAPIKETLACALLSLSPYSADLPFADPFCGSGTLVIEAAMSALGIAPGRNRDFDFVHWKNFDRTVHAAALEEALSLESPRKLPFAGYDADPAAVRLALRHAERAGVREYVHFQVRDVASFSSSRPRGCIVTNPPYGERLLTPRETDRLYKTFGEVCSRLPSWSINVITSAPSFEKAFGRKSDKNRKLFNANKECRFYQYL